MEIRQFCADLGNQSFRMPVTLFSLPRAHAIPYAKVCRNRRRCLSLTTTVHDAKLVRNTSLMRSFWLQTKNSTPNNIYGSLEDLAGKACYYDDEDCDGDKSTDINSICVSKSQNEGKRKKNENANTIDTIRSYSLSCVLGYSASCLVFFSRMGLIYM